MIFLIFNAKVSVLMMAMLTCLAGRLHCLTQTTFDHVQS